MNVMNSHGSSLIINNGRLGKIHGMDVPGKDFIHEQVCVQSRRSSRGSSYIMRGCEALMDDVEKGKHKDGVCKAYSIGLMNRACAQRISVHEILRWQPDHLLGVSVQIGPIVITLA